MITLSLKRLGNLPVITKFLMTEKHIQEFSFLMLYVMGHMDRLDITRLFTGLHLLQ